MAKRKGQVRNINLNEYVFRRVVAGITQRRMAHLAGVSYNNIKGFEQQGERYGKRLTMKLLADRMKRAYAELPDPLEKTRSDSSLVGRLDYFVKNFGFRIADNRPLIVIAEDDLMRFCRSLIATDQEIKKQKS